VEEERRKGIRFADRMWIRKLSALSLSRANIPSSYDIGDRSLLQTTTVRWQQITFAKTGHPELAAPL
jgi:hypothetical protein